MTNNENTFNRPIHYLGSKLRMLDEIKAAIDFVDPTCGAVCDLFSGSGTVSKYMTQFRDVIAVDIQNYSSILCEASIRKLPVRIDADTIYQEILESENRKNLYAVFSELIRHEQSCMEAAQNASLAPLYEIIEKGSIYIFMNEDSKDYSEGLKNALQSTITALRSQKLDHSELSMITRYYGGLYFSYRQAVELDSIADYAFSKSGLISKKILAALLTTTSEIVNTVGKQFAQPLKVRMNDGRLKASLKNKILGDRGLDPMAIFKNSLDYYLNVGTEQHMLKTMCMDYATALEGLDNNLIKVVYADPPYTRYHYSRYYHVLETICLRDNPLITTTFPGGKGGISRAIYREGRHQSPFCIKTQAEGAFRKMFKEISSREISLVLSYSPFDASKAGTPRLKTIDQLVAMAKEYFPNVEVRSPGTFTHSKLNSVDKNYESNHEAELLILCY